jgi:pheromone shutdown protein TraB
MAVRCQIQKVNDVIIVGSVHSSNMFYNSDTLFKVIQNLRPDVILIEQDSTSYTFKTGVFKPLPGWSKKLRKIGLRSELGVEAEMIQKYHAEFPEVVIRPHDVAFNGSERERHRKSLLKLQDEFTKAMFKAYDGKEMPEYQAEMHLTLRKYYQFLNRRVEGTLQELNADSTTEMIRDGEEIEKLHLRALVDSVPSLQNFSNRIIERQKLTKYRNDVMIQQVLRYVNEFKGKRIVVLTGALHRYYLLDGLVPHKETSNFRFLDIYGEEVTFLPKNM